jgi:hypothetical protein
MRSRLVIVSLIALGLAGCDENALRMAKEAHNILSAYERELEQKLASEQRAYTQQAQIEAEAVREQMYSSLEQERIERARSLALDFIEGKQDVRRWREPIRDYAKADYAIQQDILLEDMNSQSRYLEKIQALTVDKQKIVALSKAFHLLSEKPALADQLKDLADFAKETKTDFDKAVCDGLAAQIKEKESRIGSSTADSEKRKAQTALDALKATQKAKGCSTSN